MKSLEILILTGLSGSGKSTAFAAFEDAGFFCVENMPADLLPRFLELPIENDPDILGLVFVMDLRSRRFAQKCIPVIENLRQNGYHFEIIFLEADEKVLLQRFSQTRRSHPLSYDNLIEGIRTEKDELKELREFADTIIDTSHFNVHELKSLILSLARKNIETRAMRINIVSFGYKYGIPSHADLIMDVRFLANPYFVAELKALDGNDPAVLDFVLTDRETHIFLDKYLNLLDYLIPKYKKEGKAYLTIAIGCTGGRHRSVAVSRTVFDHVSRQENHVGLTHRDIDK